MVQAHEPAPTGSPLLPTITPHFTLQTTVQSTTLMVVPQPYKDHNVCYPGEVVLWDADTATKANGITSTGTKVVVHSTIAFPCANTVTQALKFVHLLSANTHSIFTLILVVPNTPAIMMEPAITSGHSSKQLDVDPDPDTIITPTSPPTPLQQLGITHVPYDKVPDSYQVGLVMDTEAQGKDINQDLLGTDTVNNIKTTTASDTVTSAPLGLITQVVHKTKVKDDKHKLQGSILIKTEDTEAMQARSSTSETENLAATGALAVDDLATATHNNKGTSITV
ncbi:hypothetical protein FIBSPDRAFT_966040 [Athelia psychrophila]|uniref:Uncharacterized protein n=1 Tax=Athelia psychrophila TaxID=1759441 RepID=A0A167X884_9AGAM|nr:hypothetical protein FIBSPDRAFT_966040 [Fibularhizoctonia sp. CBS 109695]